MSKLIHDLWLAVRAHHETAGRFAASLGMSASSLSRALSAGAPGGASDHDPQLSMVEWIASGLGYRVGLLSGHDVAIVAALTDAADALRRAEKAATDAGDDRVAQFARATCAAVVEMAAENSAPTEAPWEEQARAAGWSPPRAEAAPKPAHRAPRRAGATVTLDSPIEALHLSVRAERVLRGVGSPTVREIVARSAAELLKLHTFGKGSLNDVRRALARHGYALAGEAAQ